MIAAAITRCWYCSGTGEARPLPQKWASVADHGGQCFDCKGTGKLCSDCGQPPTLCECEETESCDLCGKLPWACTCEP